MFVGMFGMRAFFMPMHGEPVVALPPPPPLPAIDHPEQAVEYAERQVEYNTEEQEEVADTSGEEEPPEALLAQPAPSDYFEFPVSPDKAVIPPEELAAFLPEWMVEEGTLFNDIRTIHGSSVSRTRSRYSWENRCNMEIEVTDAGPAAGAEIFSALGFNFSITNHVTESGFEIAEDYENMLINHEYDSREMTGSFQILVKGRFLVEIQLERLPLESFDLILDEQLSVGALMSLAELPQQ